MSILHDYDPVWEDVRGDSDQWVYEDDTILIATDFEGGNGRGMRRFAENEYGLVLEPDPGEHRFMGVGYYFCFGVVNKLAQQRTIKVRLRTRVHFGESWHDHHHLVVRQAGEWRQLDPGAVGTNREDLEVTLQIPAAGTGEPLFVSNFHWWPGSERNAWLDSLSDARVATIGASHEGRPIRVAEIGREDDAAPCLVMSQTSQSSEVMGAHACRFIADYLLSDDEDAARIRDELKVCIIPNTNPDGAVRGHCVTDARGRFLVFEADLAAAGDSRAPVENQAMWSYLQQQRPALFWEWHSNSWYRRPGHVLIRYRSSLVDDAAKRKLWDTIDERMLELPNTHFEEFISHDESPYQPTPGFQTATKLGAISCMIKQHERFDLQESRNHAIACMKIAAAAFRELGAS